MLKRSMSNESNASTLILGIDTCGPAGSVALARLSQEQLEILDRAELEGKTYSATLVAAVSEVLGRQGIKLGSVGCLVVVSGPGSFTGVRIGLSAAKGFAEGAGIPLVAVSRLEVLAHKAGARAAALDAHRREVFLRDEDGELLAGIAELQGMMRPAGPIAICEDAPARLLDEGWPGAELVRVDAPSAADAIDLARPLILKGQFADVERLDGHYLRRSDAEIFGEGAPRPTAS